MEGSQRARRDHSSASHCATESPFLCTFDFQNLNPNIFVFFAAELNVELSRPLKINPTLAKLEQAKAYLEKVLPNHSWDTASQPKSMSSPSSTPKHSPTKAFSRIGTPRLDPHHQQASAAGKAASFKAPSLPFHKVSLQTAQMVVVMETEAHPVKPSVTFLVSAMTGSLNVKSGPRKEGQSQMIDYILFPPF